MLLKVGREGAIAGDCLTCIFHGVLRPVAKPDANAVWNFAGPSPHQIRFRALCEIMRLPGFLLVAGLVGLGAQAYAAAPSTGAANGAQARHVPAKATRQQQLTEDDICRTVAQAAVENQLPADFFARVIWQESRFNARAVSPKGAEGIAQFTPQTAVFRGLANPFDPISSLENAARYLGDLRNMFGNLGLAAAGYNAGPGRVREWLDGKSGLPRETRNYVTITTGRTADEWASRSPPQAPDNTIPEGLPCGSIARLILAAPLTEAALTGAGRIAACVPPWGTAVTAIWSRPRGWAYRLPQMHLASMVGDREPNVLRKRFGNLGRAAACANADPAWVREWRADKGALIATAWAGDGWALPRPVDAAEAGAAQGAATASTTPVVLEAPAEGQHSHLPIWGAQLTANWSREGAWATYHAMQKQFASLIGDRTPIVLHGSFPGLGAAPRYMIRIADNSRAPLEELCSKLIAAGGACAVLRNAQDQGAQPPDPQSQ